MRTLLLATLMSISFLSVEGKASLGSTECPKVRQKLASLGVDCNTNANPLCTARNPSDLKRMMSQVAVNTTTSSSGVKRGK